MSSNLNALLSEFQPYAKGLVQVAGASGLLPRVTSTLRTRAEQTRLFDAYLRRGRTGLPAAPPGMSAHEFGYAFDMVVSPFEYLPAVGAYWQQLGGVWHPSDPVHFEYPGFTPPEKSSLAANIFDLATGFIPIFGEAQIAAEILRSFPGLSESQALLILAEPHRIFNLI